MSFLSELAAYKWALGFIPLLLAVLLYKQVLRLFGVVMIPENAIGVVNKKFVLLGQNKTLPGGKIVALQGEAGLQADTLAPGVHFWLFPWQYEVALVKFVTIPEGSLGVVEACDGAALTGGRVLGRHVECDAFQDARAFLTQGGERGPQLTIIPPGTYRINPQLFTVTQEKVVEIPSNQVGVVTTRDGNPLPAGEIAGKDVQGHNNFQNAQAFIDAGGCKGLQQQVILAGRYYVNPRFATVELAPMTEVPIAHAGVVISYVGAEGKDVTGDSFQHGNLVGKGQKGVWAEPLDPGKYPINPKTHKVENVPTANVVLNWATGKTESHNLDKNLSTITVRSADGFAFNLDVSQIIHIPRNDAPKVIARFGTVLNLVSQVLEPLIGNYFRNAAQKSDVISFLGERSTRQEEARRAISDALRDFNVGAANTLIGDIVPPAELMKTLTDKKVAEQQTVTFETQQKAQEQRQKLEQATAMANTQKEVVASERQVAIAEFEAQSAVKKATGEANSRKIAAETDAAIRVINAEKNAEADVQTAEGQAKAKKLQAAADAEVLIKVGDAEASKIRAIGDSEAAVIEKKTLAIGQGNYATIESVKALATSKLQLVPQIVTGGQGSGDLLTLLLSGKLFGDMSKGATNGVPAVAKEVVLALEPPKAG